MVVACCHQRWINGRLYHGVLRLLLSLQGADDRADADELLFRIYGGGLLCLLADAGDHRVLLVALLRQVYLSQHQVRLDSVARELARAGGGGPPWSLYFVEYIYRSIKWGLPKLHVLAGMVDRGQQWPRHQASLCCTLKITR